MSLADQNASISSLVSCRSALPGRGIMSAQISAPDLWPFVLGSPEALSLTDFRESAFSAIIGVAPLIRHSGVPLIAWWELAARLVYLKTGRAVRILGTHSPTDAVLIGGVTFGCLRDAIQSRPSRLLK